MRGIAAIVIVFRHLSERTNKFNISARGFNGDDIGLWGVDLFFVISGFMMVFITNADRASFRYVLNFWMRRFFRISPLYYLMTVVVVFVAMYIPHSIDVIPSYERTIYSLLYIPIYNIHPVLGVGWTLNYEIYFYFIFGVVLFIPKKFQDALMTFYFFISVLFGYFYLSDNPIILQITNPLLIEFMLGVFVGRFYSYKKIWSVTYSLIILFLSCFIIIYADFLNIKRELRFLVYGIPCAGLVSSLIALEARNIFNFDAKLLLLAGDSSYSLYLVHLLVIGGYGKFVIEFALYNFINGYVLLFCGFFICFLSVFYLGY